MALVYPRLAYRRRLPVPYPEVEPELPEGEIPPLVSMPSISPLSPPLDMGLEELPPFTPPAPTEPGINTGAKLYEQLASLGYPGWVQPKGLTGISPEQRLVTPEGIPKVQSLRDFVLETAKLTPQAKEYLRKIPVGTTSEEQGQPWGGYYDPLSSRIDIVSQYPSIVPSAKLPRLMAHEFGHAWDRSQETPFGIQPTLVPRSFPTRLFSSPEMLPLIKDYIRFIGPRIKERGVGAALNEWYAEIVEGNYPRTLAGIPIALRPLFAGLWEAPEPQPEPEPYPYESGLEPATIRPAEEPSISPLLPPLDTGAGELTPFTPPSPAYPGIDLEEEQARLDALRRRRIAPSPAFTAPPGVGGLGENLGRLAATLGNLPTPSLFAPSEAMTFGELGEAIAEPVGKVLEPYYKKVVQPLGGALAAAGLGPMLPGQAQDAQRRVKEKLEQGMNLWEALGAVQEERPEILAGEKFIEEFLADPLNLIGLGWEPNVARALAKSAKTIGQATTKTGKAIAKKALPTARRVLAEEAGGVKVPGEAGGTPPGGLSKLAELLQRARQNPRNVSNAELDAALQEAGFETVPGGYGKVSKIRTLEKVLAQAEGRVPPAEIARGQATLPGAKTVSGRPISRRKPIPDVEEVMAETDQLKARIQEKATQPDAEDFLDLIDDALAKQAGDAGLPKGTPPPVLSASTSYRAGKGRRGGGKPPKGPKGPQGGVPDPEDVPGAVTAMIEGIPGEANGRAAFRHWDGRRGIEALEVQQWWKKGNTLLRQMKIGKAIQGRRVLSRVEGEPLLKALHGEGPVPPELQSLFDDLKAIGAQEQADMLATDPSFSQMILAHPDYFPRLWRAPRETEIGARRMGAKPGFLKPRVDATFTEMLEAGWEPLSWNPYDMLALRRIAGVEYRESLQLLNKLKKWGEAMPVSEAPDGWRVPQVGPAFEGKPFALPDGGVMYTKRWAIPDRYADMLENLYGKRPEVRVAGVDVLPGVRFFSNGAKRVKLLGSLFQHFDFAMRTGFVSATPTAIANGSIVKYPMLLGRLAHVSLSKTPRDVMRTRILSGDPILKGSDISLRMIAEEGWQVGGDTSILRRSILSFLENVGKDAPTDVVKLGADRIDRIARFMEDGLFEGVYRESQAYALENFIVPALRRNHPDWTSRQLAGAAGEEVNKMFSTLADWQTVFNSPAAREITRAVLFSTNESEAWIRQGVSMLRGENRRLWWEYGIGTMVWLTLLGNAINLAATGELMPPEAYSPLTIDPVYGVSFNSKFMSPKIPGIGRNSTDVFLDLVGQADTLFRWVLDAPGALGARYNVLPRALLNQAKAQDFFGRPLETPQERVRQFAQDLFEPIGPGALLEAGRQVSPALEEMLPEKEGRLGLLGNLLQTTGMNLRGEWTRAMLDRYAKESGYKTDTGEPVKTWDALEPWQKKELGNNKQLAAELLQRQATEIARGDIEAKGRKQLTEVDEARYHQEEALSQEFHDGRINAEAFRDRYGDIQGEAAVQKARLDTAFQIFKQTDELPEDPNKRALVQYYAAWDDARTESGRVDFDKVEADIERLERAWTQEQKAYVERNTKLADHPPGVQQYLKDRETLKPYWNVPRELDKAIADFQRIGDKAQYLEARYGAGWRDYLTEPEKALYKARDKSIDLNRLILRNKSSLVDQALIKWHGYGEAKPVPTPTPTPQPHIPLPPTKRGQAPSEEFLKDMFVVQASKEWKLPGRPYYNQLTEQQRKVISERYEQADNIVKRKLGMSLTQVVDALLTKGVNPKTLFDILETEMGAFPKAPLAEPTPVLLPAYR